MSHVQRKITQIQEKHTHNRAKQKKWIDYALDLKEGKWCCMQTHIHTCAHSCNTWEMHLQGNITKKILESISQTCTVTVGIVHVYTGERPAKTKIIVVKNPRGN